MEGSFRGMEKCLNLEGGWCVCMYVCVCDIRDEMIPLCYDSGVFTFI